MRQTVLDLTTGLPERSLAAGEVLYREGDPGSTSVVLVTGELLVEMAGTTLDRHDRPGTILGEMAALLHQPRGATVVAVTPSVVREVGHPEAVFAEHPELAIELARQLAGRLHRLQAYLGEVQRQYADRDDHLGMVSEVLGRLSARPPTDFDAGSDRSPDY